VLDKVPEGPIKSNLILSGMIQGDPFLAFLGARLPSGDPGTLVAAPEPGSLILLGLGLGGIALTRRLRPRKALARPAVRAPQSPSLFP
jgi:hypothetical protein